MSEHQAVFPFFVGCPRSGTTLLRAMFDSHSQLAIPGESHFILKMARRGERYDHQGGFAAKAFVDDLVHDEQFQRWQLAGAVVRDAIVSKEPACFADAVRTLFAAYARDRGKPLYGDKTPGFVRELPLLAELFPEARFVHLLRDGRDVLLSLLERDWAQRGGFDTLAKFWRTNVDLAFDSREKLGPGRYREIRYEELVADPETALADVCAFLGMPYESRMLSYHERAGQLAASFRDSGDHRHLHRPPVKGLRDWRTQMSKAEVAHFDRLAGDALERAGYGRAT